MVKRFFEGLGRLLGAIRRGVLNVLTLAVVVGIVSGM